MCVDPALMERHQRHACLTKFILRASRLKKGELPLVAWAEGGILVGWRMPGKHAVPADSSWC